MRVCILGSLEVWEDGTPIQLGPGRQRALLALLVLHANEVVSPDRLIDALWGERAPPTATKVIQGYVSQLRKVLPSDVLVTQAGGYVLRGTETDAAEFEQLVEGARSQEPADAARTLRRALALWRGRPLTDVEYEVWAQTEIARLEDLRLAALEDRIDVELQLGRQVHVVPEIEALVAEHPLRERLRCQLMLALYRTGRQADALNAYADARRRLVDELGIEPGPALQDLQRRVLAQDPELGPIAGPRPLAPRRRARLLVGVGALLVAGAVAGTAVELTGERVGPAAPSVVPDSLAIVDPTTNSLSGQVDILGAPSLVAAGGSSIWVVSDLNRTISLIDAGTRARTRVVAPGVTPGALAADGDAVWVLDGYRRELLKIDPAYGAPTRRIALPRAPHVQVSNRDRGSLSVSGGAGALWVTDGSTRLLRVDRESRRVVRALDVQEPLDDVAVGSGVVWAISGRAASVFRIDTQAHAVETRIRVVNRLGKAAPFPFAVVVGEGSVWVLNRNTQTVSRIDPEFGGVTATIPLGIGRNPSDLAAGAGAVWVANGGDGTLARIDPDTNSVATVALGGSPSGVAVGGGRVWVSIQPGFRALARSPVEQAHPSPKSLPASICSAVEFPGKGHPRYLIASDLPFQGLAAAAETLQMSDAVRFILAKRQFRAGPYSVGYQSCDDSIASTGSYDVDRCRANAQAYAATKSLIGVIGGFNSGCVQAQLAAFAGAPGGPLAIVGTASTYVGLTHVGPGTSRGEPRKYYPQGVRSFVRVVAADDLQGAANAILAKRLGVRRLFVVHDGDPYGSGIAASVRRAATRLGLDVVGLTEWDPRARAYGVLGRTVRGAGADGVFLGGSADISNGYSLVKSLRAVLGERFHILVPDGFTPVSAFARLAGPAAEGVTLTLSVAAPERLRGEGERFVAEFGEAIGRPVEAYSVAAAQATEVLLDAIARSDGTRASVTDELFKTNVTNGILGRFSFDRNGDTTAGAVTIYRIVRGEPTIFSVITPSPSLAR